MARKLWLLSAMAVAMRMAITLPAMMAVELRGKIRRSVDKVMIAEHVRVLVHGSGLDVIRLMPAITVIAVGHGLRSRVRRHVGVVVRRPGRLIGRVAHHVSRLLVGPDAGRIGKENERNYQQTT